VRWESIQIDRVKAWHNTDSLKQEIRELIKQRNDYQSQRFILTFDNNDKKNHHNTWHNNIIWQRFAANLQYAATNYGVRENILVKSVLDQTNHARLFNF
jgi:FtsZ-binding cell division protein ZapB